MAATKADIVHSIMEKTGFSIKRSTEITEVLIDIIKRTLISGEDVLISGFGKFCVNQKSERRGRNPATGEPMILSSRKVVTFKSSGRLRNNINSR
jgi:integration host factor subunit alpha